MRILLVSSIYPSPISPYIGFFVQRQVAHLNELGVECELAVSNLPARKDILRKYAGLAYQTFQRFDIPFDLVHVHWPVFPGLLGWLASMRRRCPLVVTIHGGEIDPNDIYTLEMGTFKRKITRSVAGWVLRRADQVIAVSTYLDSVAKQMGVSEEKIAVINMGVDTTIFKPYAKTAARKHLRLSDKDRKIIVTVAYLMPLKGHSYLIKAMVMIRKAHPSCRLYLVGTGYLETELKRLISQSGLEGHVVFAGQRPPDEIVWWMSAADIVVVPSIAESFGLTALEAAACGTPTVASDVGGLSDHVIEGENGFLIPPGDPAAIARTVNMLFSNPSLLDQMQSRCVASAQKHDSRLQARKVLSLYEGLLHGHSGAPS